MVVLNDPLFSKSFNPFRIPSYLIPYLFSFINVDSQPGLVSVDSDLPYLIPVISSGEQNYMKENLSERLVDVSYITYLRV